MITWVRYKEFPNPDTSMFMQSKHIYHYHVKRAASTIWWWWWSCQAHNMGSLLSLSLYLVQSIPITHQHRLVLYSALIILTERMNMSLLVDQHCGIHMWKPTGERRFEFVLASPALSSMSCFFTEMRGKWLFNCRFERCCF